MARSHARTSDDVPGAYVPRTFSHDTTRGVLAREVYRRPGTGPTVILIHEAPGMSPRTVAIADRLADHDYTVALPVLMHRGTFGPAALRVAIGFASFCVAHELSAFAGNRTGAIVEWLRALARDESAMNGGRPVAVIGMCFSAGYALGAILDPAVNAAVMSQPGLPFAVWPGRSRDLGVSSTDLAAIRGRIGDGDRVRIMRYARDAKSPRQRYDRVIETFPACGRREIPTDDRNDHSVLADAVTAPAGSDLDLAFDETLAFLERHLSG
jgi:dienelactone hydrolase